MKIKEYCIVTAKCELPALVNALLNQGWQPYGYVFLDRNGLLKQSMVKYEDEAPKVAPKKTKKADKVASNED